MRQLICMAAGLALAASLPAAEPVPAREEPAVVTTPAAAPGAARERAAPVTPQAPAPAATDASPPASDAAGQTRDAAASRPPGNVDRIELGVTQITGNAELPRVMYVVPWKRAELGDVGGRPAKSLLDEVLEPVDRDVFRRQNRYYEALQPDAASKQP